MKGTKLAVVVGMTVAAVSLAAPAQADDYDAPFNNTIHRFGIYGPQDYNAWLAKISCERLSRGVDGDAYKSATFLQRNLPRGTTQGQAFQFLGAAIDHYCPEHVGVLQRAGTRYVFLPVTAGFVCRVCIRHAELRCRRSGCATAPPTTRPAKSGAPAPPGRARP